MCCAIKSIIVEKTQCVKEKPLNKNRYNIAVVIIITSAWIAN